MELTWLECLVYGLISGFTEFLPVSSVAHQAILLKLLGARQVPVLQFCASAGCLAALLLVFLPKLLHMHTERRLAAVPKNRRRRPPDLNALVEDRVLRMSGITGLVLFIIYVLVHDLYERLWILSGIMVINGIVLFLPPYLLSANKSARSLSGLDALLIGLAAGCGILPGLSRFGCAVSVARIRGADRRYAADLALMLSIPLLAVWSVILLVSALGTIAVTGAVLLCALTVLLSAFVAAYLAICFVRFLAYRAGYSGFAYYCWGAALFTLLLYLI